MRDLVLTLAALAPKVPKAKPPDEGIDAGATIAGIIIWVFFLALAAALIGSCVYLVLRLYRKNQRDALALEAERKRAAAGLSPMADAAPQSHVIERQTVVVRCKFCKALTPADAGTCQQCGSGSFS